MHWISGLIGERPKLMAIAAEHGLTPPALLEMGLGFLPLDEENLPAIVGTAALRTPESLEAEEDGEVFDFLTPELTAWCARHSVDCSLIYVETRYWAGAGGQGAAVFERGKLAWGPEMGGSSAISTALERFGVQRRGRFDAFDMVGLGRLRSNDDWRR